MFYWIKTLSFCNGLKHLGRMTEIDDVVTESYPSLPENANSSMIYFILNKVYSNKGGIR